MNTFYALGFIICCYLLAATIRQIKLEIASRPAALHTRPTSAPNVTPYVPSVNQQSIGQSKAKSISGTAPCFISFQSHYIER